jgi:hypothetical protein
MLLTTFIETLARISNQVGDGFVFHGRYFPTFSVRESPVRVGKYTETPLASNGKSLLNAPGT